jgi:mycothiol synthase
VSPGLAEGLTVRPPREDELDALIDFMNVVTMEEAGVPDADRDELLRTFRKETFDTGRDAWVVEDDAGAMVGFAWVELETAGGDIVIDGYTHPAHLERGIGSRLSDLAERRAVEIAGEQDKKLPVEVFRGAWSGSPAGRFLEGRGYERTRSFIRMRIDMHEPPPEPAWPEGITVAGFERGRDERLFHLALDEGFQDHWRWTPIAFDDWMLRMIEHDDGFDGSLWFRAMEGDDVAGAIVTRPRTAEDPDAAWVEDLAVRRPWRRRGVAQALLLHELGELYRRGIHTAMLAVDSESPTGATRLYERVGMFEHRRIDVYVKALGGPSSQG